MARPALVLVPVLLGYAGAAHAVDFLPHRAIYDISLDQTAPDSNIASANGRLVYEITGSACSGYASSSRFVIQFRQAEGGGFVSDFRTTTFEEPETESFTFRYETYIDEALTEQAQGEARREGESIVVEARLPEPRRFNLPGTTLFPYEMTTALIEAGEAGRPFVQAHVFDGSSAEVDTYSVSTVIGAERPGEEHTVADPALDDVAGWHASLAYFDEAAGGDMRPSFTLSGNIFANGVAGDTTYNYGDLAVRARLTSLVTLAETPCD